MVESKLEEVYCKLDIIQVGARLYLASGSVISNRSWLLVYSWMADSISCSRSCVYPKQIRQQWRTSVSLQTELSIRDGGGNKGTSDYRNILFPEQMQGRKIVCGQEWTDKPDKTENNCSFSTDMIKGFADPKIHTIGQSVHHGRLIELEKPEEAGDYIWSDSSRESETPETRQRFLVDGIIAGDLSIQFSHPNILTLSSWNWRTGK